MKNFFRRIVKKILSNFTNIYIRKNNIKILSVFGNYSQDILVEAIYFILKDNGVNAYRNYIDFEKDLDVPFFILTREEMFQFFKFLWVVISFPFIAMFSKKYKDSVFVVNLSTFNAGVVKYFSGFLSSDIFLIYDITKKSLIYEDQIMKDSKEGAKIILDGDSNSKKLLTFDFSKEILTFGKKSSNNLVLSYDHKKIELTYEENNMEIQNTFKDLDPKVIASAVLMCITYGINFHNCVSSIQKFTLPNRNFQKVFEKFVK